MSAATVNDDDDDDGYDGDGNGDDGRAADNDDDDFDNVKEKEFEQSGSRVCPVNVIPKSRLCMSLSPKLRRFP